jgi:hypothetical protein
VSAAAAVSVAHIAADRVARISRSIRAICVRVDDSTVNAWEDLRVGDRVRVFVTGARNTRTDVFDLVELRRTDEVLGRGTCEAVAVIRSADGEVQTVIARMLRAARDLV